MQLILNSFQINEYGITSAINFVLKTHIFLKSNKRAVYIISYLLLIFNYSYSQQTAKNEETAKNFLDLLQKEEYAKCISLFDTSVTSKIGASQLDQIWTGLNQQLGEYKNLKTIRLEQKDSFEIVHQICQFEKTIIDFKLTFNKKGVICGIFFAPPTAEGGYKEPSYANSRAFNEQNITIHSGEYALPGTLTLPIGGEKFPLVILVAGSGPNDRDETIGPNKPLKDIAWALASNRIAVFRYDKRTLIYGSKIVNQQITVKEEVIDDVISCLKQLKINPVIDSAKIFLLGHSLGAMLMPRISLSDKNVSGIIMMAGNARPLEDLIVSQMTYLMDNSTTKSKEEAEQLEKMKSKVKYLKENTLTLQTPSSDLPLGIPAAYWMDLKKYNPVETLKKLTLPVLILQGEKDYQVTMQDYNLWKDGIIKQNNVVMKSYPKLNHLFMEFNGEKSLPADYQIPSNVAEYVVSDIIKWVKEH
ncbi:MAG: DUF3887 domain-containing protein [Bacteroidetes bacterium]|nr:DUF3887 domain-containing protein [Bacteroidota bacterium]